MNLKNDLETVRNNPPSLYQKLKVSGSHDGQHEKMGKNKFSVTRCHNHTWSSSILCSCSATFFSLTFPDLHEFF